ncbi:MAG: 2-isopropylmalate synthase [Gemmatimonadetes bacterium]|nr:2-isopropylmalate synthase [Gemmatimonadota bacterium]MYB99916.1 2-isopropylmalate synthase [Gemmatimonadota bacterium]MYI45390.1 2-isopropylmalate synthase [Gemmatimonadota bacterium]
MDDGPLINDWNVEEFETLAWGRHVELDDETLRDGLQSPSVIDPPVGAKIKLLHMMDELGIHTANIGLPGAGPRAVADITRLCEEIRDARLSITPNSACRTMLADVQPAVRISHETGVPLEVCAFIGSSPIRLFAEGWTIDGMLRTAEESVSFAVREGLPVMFVTEDTTRADGETLKALYGNAIRWGARRICLSDTVGHATPSGVRALIRFVKREIVDPSGANVKIDWHGHRDRGLGLANALVAIEAGADRIHATAMGIGERVGNVQMDLLLVNLALAGVHHADLTRLADYCELVSRECGVPLPSNYPVLGSDAFRTATGVHAAAIVKAQAKGANWLADRVYSGVPAAMVGRRQEIEIGPMSGISNVRYWLEQRGYDPDDSVLCQRIFARAKNSDHTLSEDEVLSIVQGVGEEPAA